LRHGSSQIRSIVAGRSFMNLWVRSARNFLRCSSVCGDLGRLSIYASSSLILQHLQFPGSKPQLAEILVWGDSHRSSLSHFQNRYLLFDPASSWLGGKSIVKNPKNDTYSPCYDANACGLLASIFGCCTIVGLCFG